ncbi:MAG: tRNA 2-selenouridine(34) synthase MnmH [Actinobacteria bacterium]|nr:tRNA 2-selenouridine(34) synthase MnmH [Actinomycetota bacterium]
MSDLQVPSVTAAKVMEGGFLVVDVRSPSEYAEGHMPGSINMPLLNDAQRGVVGLAYKEHGAAKARVAAMDEVTPGLTAYLHELVDLAALQPRRRRLAIMCWRGGERSRNVVLLLALIGVHAVAISGGYRAYRREVLAGLDQWAPTVPVVTLYGHTGGGKSALLRALTETAPNLSQPRPWPLNLEELALHRGSVLGGLNQPGERQQKDFDALLWDQLRHPRGHYLVMEGEGGKIGRIFLPARVAEAVRTGLPVLVRAPLEARAARIVSEYGPEKWTESDVVRFRRSLGVIGARIPRKTLVSLETAFDDGRFTDVVRELLVQYYDPLYERSCVEGRRFLWEFETGVDPAEDAQRFARDIARLIEEVPSSGFPS